MAEQQEKEKTGNAWFTGVCTIIAAFVTGVFGVMYGKSTVDIVINNLQGESIEVSPLKAEQEYADLYSKYLDIKDKNNLLEKKLLSFGRDPEALQQVVEQRDRVQGMLDICESKIGNNSESKNKDSVSVNSSVVGKWKGQVIDEGLPVVVSLDVESLKLGEKTMTITYGSPRTCTSKGEYAGKVEQNEELFYLRDPTPMTWCGQFTYFTDATIKLRRTSSSELNYEIQDIRKFKKRIESATISEKSR